MAPSQALSPGQVWHSLNALSLGLPLADHARLASIAWTLIQLGREAGQAKLGMPDLEGICSQVEGLEANLLAALARPYEEGAITLTLPSTRDNSQALILQQAFGSRQGHISQQPF